MQIKVRCLIEVELEVPDSWNRDRIKWQIEENSCPGTGIVGAAIEDRIKWADENSVCPFCPEGRNIVLEIDGMRFVQ